MKNNKDIKLTKVAGDVVMCGAGPACPAVYSFEQDGKKKYVIVGKKTDPKEFGIADKVSNEEQAVTVDLALLEQIFGK